MQRSTTARSDQVRHNTQAEESLMRNDLAVAAATIRPPPFSSITQWRMGDGTC